MTVITGIVARTPPKHTIPHPNKTRPIEIITKVLVEETTATLNQLKQRISDLTLMRLRVPVS